MDVLPEFVSSFLNEFSEGALTALMWERNAGSVMRERNAGA